MDLQLESGEYFLAQEERSERTKEAQQQKQADRVAERKRKREAAFDAPAQVTEDPDAALAPCLSPTWHALSSLCHSATA